MSTPRDSDFDWRIRIRGMSEDEVATAIEKLEATVTALATQVERLAMDLGRAQIARDDAERKLAILEPVAKAYGDESQAWAAANKTWETWHAVELERDAWKEQAILAGIKSPGIQDRNTVTLILEGRVRRALARSSKVPVTQEADK